jgi:hypothetical protein
MNNINILRGSPKVLIQIIYDKPKIITKMKRVVLVLFYEYHFHFHDRLYGLVVRVLGYRSGGPGSIPGTTKKK